MRSIVSRLERLAAHNSDASRVVIQYEQGLTVMRPAPSPHNEASPIKGAFLRGPAPSGLNGKSQLGQHWLTHCVPITARLSRGGSTATELVNHLVGRFCLRLSVPIRRRADEPRCRPTVGRLFQVII